MKTFFASLIVGLLFVTLAAAQGLSLNQVYSQMDSRASGFNNVQGDISYTKYTKIVDEKETNKGQFFFERGKKHDSKDIRIRINFTQPADRERAILLKENEGQIYYPKAKQVEIYNISGKRQALDQFLLLGFGSTSRDLQSAYAVALGDANAKAGGEDAVRLDLTPKSEATARSIKGIQLFLSKKTWQPIKQVFTEPSGDSTDAEYNNLKFNQRLPNGTFELKLPKDVKRVHPQS